MRILFILLVSLFLVSCHSDKQVKGYEFLQLNAVSNTISYSNENVIYSTWDTAVSVYDLKAGAVIFTRKIKDVCYAKPIAKNGRIFFPFSDDKFVCVDAKDGKLLWELELKGRCSNFDFLDDTTIAASTKHNGLVVLNADKGRLLYELKYNYEETHLPDLSPWLISFDEQNFYVSNWQGHSLSSFKKKDGTVNWQFDNKEQGMAGQSIVDNDRIFVGINEAYKNGRILLLTKKNGGIFYQEECKYEEREAPVLYKNSVYFYSYDRFLNRFNLSANKIERVKGFEKDFDLSGHQMFLNIDDIYFSDASFMLNCYSIKDNTFKQIQKTEKSIIGAHSYNGTIYIIE